MASKYKLHSQSSDGVKYCAFYLTPEGCRNGANCKFSHGDVPVSTPAKCTSISVESSSVVSSESSDDESFNHVVPKSSTKSKKNSVKKENESLQQSEFQNNLRLLQEQQRQLVELQKQLFEQQNAGQKKKTKKRKHKDAEDTTSVFAAPPKSPSSKKSKSQAEVKTQTPTIKPSESASKKKSKHKEKQTPKKVQPQAGSYAALAYASASSETSESEESEEESDEGLQYLAQLKEKLTKKEETPTKQPTYDPSSFALKMKLPIAPFEMPETPSKASKASTPAKSSETKEETPISLPCPLPAKSSEAYKFVPAIEASRKNPKYKRDYNFARHKKDDVETDWFKTGKATKKHLSCPQAIAIDCEMVETQDPVTKKKDHKALARLSVVNAIDTSEVLLDTLVKPHWPVTDYRTWVNGITKKSLENVQFTLRHAQAFMMALCSEETVIIGHALMNDLVALKMEHHCNADTSFLFKVKGDEEELSTPSLKDCAIGCLGKDMPDTHDSVNDALTSLNVCLHYLDKDGNVEAVTKTPKNLGPYAKDNLESDTLLVHRIPAKGVTKNDISALFVQNAYVKPKEVDDIKFGGSTGKTSVRFATALHSRLAFDTLPGEAKLDKSGREQKKAFLRNKEYIQIRRMTRPKGAKHKGKQARKST